MGTRPTAVRKSRSPISFMPVAFKEWAVTVRALAEGEQLLTLRKGGIREENKHFELEHDRFFLYPTFDHQRNNLVRQSHHPELRRALEEGVWADGEPPPKALIQDGGIEQPDRVRIRAWAEVHEHYEVADPRIVDALSPVPHLDAGLRLQAPALEAAPSAARARAAGLPHPAPRDGAGAARVRGLHVVGRDRPRPAVRGHSRDRRRGVRARRGGHRRDRARGRRARAGAASRSPDRGSPGRSRQSVARRRDRALVLGIGGGGDVVGALASAHALRAARHARRARRRHLGAAADRPPTRARGRPTRSSTRARSARACCSPARRPRTVDGALFAESHMARLLGEDTVLVDVGPAPAPSRTASRARARRARRDLSCCVDVGGDVLGDGSEPGLASPLCDAVMLAAVAHAAAPRRTRCWPPSSAPAATAS